MSALISLSLAFIMDLAFGDPRFLLHPVVLMGKLISSLEHTFRRMFPHTPRAERIAGALIWLLTASVSYAVPLGLLLAANAWSPYVAFALNTFMSWQALAIKSLSDETLKVYKALKADDISGARKALSYIVGRDTDRLDRSGIIRAAIETVAENASDGVIAPMLFLALGGAPLGFLYKAVNTMDSMLGYIDPPYTNIGFIPAKMDDIFNFIPARLTALCLWLAGAFMRLDVKNGMRIFKRDRFNHASPNSAQSEAMVAGLLDVRLAGDAYYRGILHKKPYIGDAIRDVCDTDIPLVCRTMYVAAAVGFIVLVPLTMLKLLWWV